MSSVVSFNTTVHKRSTGNDQWESVRVCCGYGEGVMLAYELLGTNSQPFAASVTVPTSSIARTYCRRGHRYMTSVAARGRGIAKDKVSTKVMARSVKDDGIAKAKSTTASKFVVKLATKETTKKSSSN